jgi:SAM-dependent methyltransferase
MFAKWRTQDPWMKQIVVPRVVYWLETNPDNFTILDYGCGQGILYDLLPTIDTYNYTGIDYSEGMLDVFRKRRPEANIVKGDITKTELPTHGYDVLVCLNTVMYFKDDLNALFNEMKRVAKNKIFFNVPLGDEQTEEDGRVVFDKGDFCWFLHTLFENKNISVINLNDHDYWLFEVTL